MDNIINLGDCLDEAGLAPYAASIHALNQRISAQFLHAYRYLGAADQLRRDTTTRWQELLDPVQLHALTQTALDALFAGLPAVPGGRERKLFAGAVTPGGCVCELESAAHKARLGAGGAVGRTVAEAFCCRCAIAYCSVASTSRATTAPSIPIGWSTC